MRIPEADYQVSIFDQFNILPERTRKMIESSVFATYANTIFKMIDPEIFTPMFIYFKEMKDIEDTYGELSGINPPGRPVRTIRTLAMACLLYHESDMGKENFVLHANTDICYLYAMHATSFTTPAFSHRNFYLFMKRIEQYKSETGIDLIQNLQESITQKMAEEMGINKLMKLGKLRIRIDSTFVDSMSRRLSRPQIIYQVNRACVLLFTKLGVTEYLLPSLSHYLDSSDMNTQTYHTSEKKKTVVTRLLVESLEIEKLMRDTFDDSQLEECQEYKNLIRMISDQTDPVDPDDGSGNSPDRKTTNVVSPDSEDTIPVAEACTDCATNNQKKSADELTGNNDSAVDKPEDSNVPKQDEIVPQSAETTHEESDNNIKVGDKTCRVKDNKDIRSDSLQNPNDPQATSRTKANENHIGRVANIEEAYDGNGNSLILRVTIRPNIFSDINFMRLFLESREDNASLLTIVADGAYISYEIQQLAKRKNVKLVVTSLIGKPTNPLFAAFSLSEDGRSIINCPNGIKPLTCEYIEDKEKIKATFPSASCSGCKYHDKCPSKGKITRVVFVTQTQLFRAQYQVQLDEKAFRIFGQERNAIEGVMSTLKRAYSLNDIQTFNGSRVETEVYGKVAAYNIKKYSRFKNQKSQKAPRGESAQNHKMVFQDDQLVA